jgi:hypothetical protein
MVGVDPGVGSWGPAKSEKAPHAVHRQLTKIGLNELE